MLIFVLILTAATLMLIWLQMGLIALLLSYPVEQWPQVFDQLITDQTRLVVILGIVFVLVNAIGLPLAAYTYVDDFLIWFKQ